MTAYREGNVIDLDFMVLQVAEACSGLRFIIPLFALGVLFSYFLQKVLWKRLVLILATIPISIVANVFRIAGTGFIALYWGEEAAQGFFHSFSGWLVFLVCLGLFALVNLALKFLPDTPSREKEDPVGSPGGHSAKRISWGLVVLAAAMVLSTPAVVSSLGEVPPVPLQKDLDDLPLTFRGYAGIPKAMDPKIWEQVGAQDYILIDYQKGGVPPVNFYVAYYEYQKKGGEFVHSPRLCLPGAGWVIEKNRVRQLTPSDTSREKASSLELNELVISRGGTKQLVYFWYQGRGRNFTNEFAAKFYMVWDGLFRRRTDGALVRVVMPLSEDQSVEAARKITDPFALAASAELRTYLP
jgi:exosortase D (VPLPA-CTERM-specific)